MVHYFLQIVSLYSLYAYYGLITIKIFVRNRCITQTYIVYGSTMKTTVLKNPIIKCLCI